MAFTDIFFDLDGTLTDPFEGISKSIKYALSHFGIEENDIDTLRSFIGPPLINTFTDHYGFDLEKAKQAIAFYRERYGDVGFLENKLIDGVSDTLKFLKKNNKKIYLATSKPQIYAEKILDSFDIPGYFDFVSGADLRFNRDEKWQVIEHIFENVDIKDRAGCVMVGDREHDVFGARKCGLKTIGVLCGFGSREELEAAGAEYIFEKFSDIVSVII